MRLHGVRDRSFINTLELDIRVNNRMKLLASDRYSCKRRNFCESIRRFTSRTTNRRREAGNIIISDILYSDLPFSRNPKIQMLTRQQNGTLSKLRESFVIIKLRDLRMILQHSYFYKRLSCRQSTWDDILYIRMPFPWQVSVRQGSITKIGGV